MSNQYKSTTHVEKFRHIKQPLNYNGKDFIGGTVFFRVDDFAAGAAVIRASVSRCSINDNWCKRTGRNIARRRYFTGKKIATQFQGNINWYEVAEQIYTGILV